MGRFRSQERTLLCGSLRARRFTSISASIATIGGTASTTTCCSRSTRKKNAKSRSPHPTRKLTPRARTSLTRTFRIQARLEITLQSSPTLWSQPGCIIAGLIPLRSVRMRKVSQFICSVAAILLLLAAAQSQEKVDLETVSRIRYEGFHDSKVMELASGLMDSIGERLTGSPNMKRANEWTRDQLTAMGLVNSHLEAWGPFGRGWANQYVNVRMTSPDVVTLLAYPKAWTPGTGGVIQGKCIRATIDDKKDFDKYKGKLAGMIVILGADAEVKPIAEAPYKRDSDDDLAKLAEYQMPPEHPPFNFAMFVKRQQFVKDLNQFFAEEKVLAVIDHSRGTSGGGTVFVQSGGSYKPGETTTVPQLTMASEHWTRIARLLQQKKDVTLELNVNNTFYDDDPMQYDTIAE